MWFGEAVVGRVTWDLQGTHNRMNALAAIAAARHVGVPPAQAIESLGRFANVKRRMEVRGEAGGVTVYDDFAHHPTAIQTTLEGLRRRVGGARILAVLEPRSNTMKLGVMKAQLPASLEQADLVFGYGAQAARMRSAGTSPVRWRRSARRQRHSTTSARWSRPCAPRRNRATRCWS